MRKIMFFMALLVLYAANAAAQITRTEGQVLDQADGQPIPGATVIVDGTTIATATDQDGKFVLSGLTAGHQKITVSFVGYEKQTVDAKANMKIFLTTKSEMIDEVIVVAFGKQKREAFTGSASVVSSDNIARQQVTNPIEALKGIVAGLQMVDNNSLSNERPVMRIRGTSSLNASNEPLIVVDGLPYSGYLNDINPADIENMTVLKDAASNALYGARGANGVIMITTKNAQRGNTKVTIDAKWGVNTNGRVEYDLIDNPGEYYEAFYRAHLNNYMYRQENAIPFEQAHIKANQILNAKGQDGGLGYIVYNVPVGEMLIGTNGRLNPHATLGNRIAYDNEVYTLYPDDWLQEGTRNGFRQEYNINITGGNEKYSVLTSIGYLGNNGIAKYSDLDRLSTRIKMDYQAYSFLKFGANAGYTHSKTNSLQGVFSTPYTVAPIYPLYLRNGAGNILFDKHGPCYDNGYNQIGLERPVEQNGNTLQDDRYDVNSNSSNAFNIQGFATVDFLKHFHLTVNGSVYITENRTKRTYNPYYGYSIESGGETTVSHYRTTDANFQQLLNYNQSFGFHTLDVLIGHEYSRSMGTGLSATSSKFANYQDNTEISGAIIPGTHSSYRSLYNVEGFFGRVQYDYDNRYFASASYRRDGSSRFHPDHRWGNFWSIGGAWIISKEGWFPENPYVNMLKFKASYGEQGNDGIGEFRYVDMYSIGNSNNNVAFTFSSKGAEDITWESVGSFNAGFEFETFNKRLNGGVEYYWRKTTDMLMYFSSPWEIGYDGYFDNIGDMTNTGIEAELNSDLVRTKNFTWNFGVNLAWQVNRITYIPAAKAGTTIDGHRGYLDDSFFYGEDLPLYTFYTKRYAGVDDSGHALYYRKGENGEMLTTTEYQLGDYFLCGNAMPKVFGGFNTSFSYKGFDLSAQFNYSLGGKKWDYGYQALMMSPLSITTGAGIHRDVFKAWTPENPDSDIPMYYYNDAYAASSSDRFLVSADYLAFRNISIGYTFPRSVTDKLKMSKLRVFGVCENVAYWTARKGFDPRANLTSGSYGAYSPMRTISGGIQIQF